MKKMNKKAVAVAGLGIAALVGGTYAYYSQSLSLDNPLTTGKYQTELVEEFTPSSEDLQPGAKIDKIVGVENTGDYPVMVRVKLDEKWVRKADSEASDAGKAVYRLTSTGLDDDGKTSVNDKDLFIAGTYNKYTITDENNEEKPVYTFTAKQTGDTDGATTGDGTVIYKHMNDLQYDSNGNTVIYNELDDGAEGNWIYNPDDGYWYWNGVLDAAVVDSQGNVTNKDDIKTTALMEYLMVATNIDLGEYKTSEYYAIVDSQPSASDAGAWTEVTTQYDPTDAESILEWAAANVDEGKKLFRMSQSNIVDGKWGYADSLYTLTIKTQVIQATTDAVADTTTGWGKSIDDITTMLTNIGTGEESDYINK